MDQSCGSGDGHTHAHAHFHVHWTGSNLVDSFGEYAERAERVIGDNDYS